MADSKSESQSPSSTFASDLESGAASPSRQAGAFARMISKIFPFWSQPQPESNGSPASPSRSEKNGTEIDYVRSPFAANCNDTAEVWESYGTQAKDSDQVLIKAFKNELDPLMLFATLFSAILAAFIIEIRKDLQEDAQATTNALLMTLIELQRNASAQTASADPFVPKGVTVWINGLWFISLIFSLTSALGASLAKSWITQFSAVPSSSWSDVRLHCSRIYGLRRWHLDVIVQCLPILLHVGFFLFLAGLAILLFGDNVPIGIAMFILAVLVALIYLGSSIHPAFFPDSPFHTPFSGAIQRLLRSLRFTRNTRLPSDPRLSPWHNTDKARALKWLLIEAHDETTITKTVHAIAGLRTSPEVQDELLRLPTVETISTMLSSALVKWKNAFVSGDEGQASRCTALVSDCLYAILHLVQCAPRVENADGAKALRELLTGDTLSSLDNIPKEHYNIALCIKWRIIFLLCDEKTQMAHYRNNENLFTTDLPVLINACGDRYIRRNMIEVSLLASGRERTDQRGAQPGYVAKIVNRQRGIRDEGHYELVQAAIQGAAKLQGVEGVGARLVLDEMLEGNDRLENAEFFAGLATDPLFQSKFAEVATADEIYNLLKWDDDKGRQHVVDGMEALSKSSDCHKRVREGIDLVLQKLSDQSPVVQASICDVLVRVADRDDVDRLREVQNLMVSAHIVRLLGSSFDEVQERGLQVVSARGTPGDLLANPSAAAELVQKIVAMLDSRAVLVRRGALKALAVLAKSDGLAGALAGNIRAFIKRLGDLDFEVQQAAVHLLLVFLSHEGLLDSISKNKMTGLICRMCSGDDSDYVTPLLLERDRRNTIDQQTLTEIVDMLFDPDQEIKKVAIDMIVIALDYRLRNGSFDMPTDLFRMYLDRRGESHHQWISGSDSPVLKGLVAQLNSPKWPVRRSILNILTASLEAGDASHFISAFQAIIKRLDDEFTEVQQAARVFLVDCWKDATLRKNITSGEWNWAQEIVNLRNSTRLSTRETVLQLLTAFVHHGDTSAFFKSDPTFFAAFDEDRETVQQACGLISACLERDDSRDFVLQHTSKIASKLAKLDSPALKTSRSIRGCWKALLNYGQIKIGDITETLSALSVLSPASTRNAPSGIWGRLLNFSGRSLDNGFIPGTIPRYTQTMLDAAREDASEDILGLVASKPELIVQCGKMLDPNQLVKCLFGLKVLAMVPKHVESRAALISEGILPTIISLLGNSQGSVQEAACTVIIACFQQKNFSRDALSKLPIEAGIFKMIDSTSPLTVKVGLNALSTLLQYGEFSLQPEKFVQDIQKTVEKVRDPDSDVNQAACDVLIAYLRRDDLRFKTLDEKYKALDEITTQLERLKNTPSSVAALKVLTVYAEFGMFPVSSQQSDILLELLGGVHPPVQQQVVEVMIACLNHPQLRGTILELVSNNKVRIIAILTSKKWKTHQSTLNLLAAFWHHGGASILSKTRDMIQGISTSLNDSGQPEVQKAACDLIFSFLEQDSLRSAVLEPENGMTERFFTMLEHKKSSVRLSALQVLDSFLGYEDSRTLLWTAERLNKIIKRLVDSDKEVRQVAFNFVNSCLKFSEFQKNGPGPELEQQLVEWLKSHSWEIRHSTLSFLAAFLKDEKSRKLFVTAEPLEMAVTLLADSDDDVQKASVTFLISCFKYEDLRAKFSASGQKVTERFMKPLNSRLLSVNLLALQVLTACLEHKKLHNLFEADLMKKVSQMVCHGAEVGEEASRFMTAYLKQDLCSAPIGSDILHKLLPQIIHPQQREACLNMIIILPKDAFKTDDASKLTSLVESTDPLVVEAGVQVISHSITNDQLREHFVAKGILKVMDTLITSKDNFRAGLDMLIAFAKYPDTRQVIVDSKSGFVVELLHMRNSDSVQPRLVALKSLFALQIV